MSPDSSTIECALKATVKLCPYLVSKVSQDIGSEGLVRYIDIGGTQANRDHNNCTSFQCYANDTQVSAFAGVKLREQDACRCPMSGPDLAKVSAILDENKVPLVALSGTANAMTILVESYTPGTDFTSVSHALMDKSWIVCDNQLLLCQLLRLRNIVKGLAFSVHEEASCYWFWIDVLCVPANRISEMSSEHLLKSIVEPVARNATRTLVLDPDIELLKLESSPEEVFMRIAYSSWSSRLWTLLEGVFAKKLYFYFSHAYMELDDIMEKKYVSCSTAIPRVWDARIPFKSFRELSLRGQVGQHLPKQQLYKFLYDALAGRRTSRPQVIPAIIVSLLDVEPSDSESRPDIEQLNLRVGR